MPDTMRSQYTTLRREGRKWYLEKWAITVHLRGKMASLRRGPSGRWRQSALGRCSAVLLGRLLRLLVVDLKRLFLRWHGETSRHALLQSRHQHVIAESLPALLRLVDGHNGPATGRRSSRVEDLALGQCSPT